MGTNRWFGLRRFFVEKKFQIIPEKIIINVFQLLLLFGRKSGAQIFFIYDAKKLFFLSLIFGKAFFKRSGNIRHIAFTGIMKKSCQCKTSWQATGHGFLCTEDTMLSYGKKGLYMAISAA